MSVTHITSNLNLSTCIKDSVGKCIILNKHRAIFGCGAKVAKIWKVRSDRISTDTSSNIKLISEL